MLINTDLVYSTKLQKQTDLEGKCCKRQEPTIMKVVTRKLIRQSSIENK